MASREFNGWVVAVIGCIINFVELGTFKSFGVLIIPIRESLSGSYTAVGTAMAASHTVCYLCIGVSAFINEKYGARRVVITGGFIMFVSFLLVALVHSVTQFSVLMISFGFGVSLVYAPPITSIMAYFPKNPALPLATLGIGSGLGMMVYPPLTEILVNTYGWRGTLFIYAAVNANVCVLGALMKDPPAEYVALETDHQRQEQSPEISATKLDVLRSRFMEAVKVLWRLLAFDLIRVKPVMTLFIFACFVNGLMYSAWMIYLVPHAVTKGIDIHRASLLSTAGGVGNLVGRIVYGPVLHREYITPVQMFILLAISNSCAFMLDTVVANNYPGMICLAFVNGFSIGTMAVLFIFMARQILETERITQGWSAMCASFALGEAAGGAFAGLLFDSAESHNVTFVVLGGLSATIVAVFTFARLPSLCLKGSEAK